MTRAGRVSLCGQILAFMTKTVQPAGTRGQPVRDRDPGCGEVSAEPGLRSGLSPVLADPLGHMLQQVAAFQARQQPLGSRLVTVDYVDGINRLFVFMLAGLGVGWFAEVG